MTKEAKAEYDKAYYLKNRDRLLSGVRRYAALNREKKSKANAAWYAKNAERLNAHRRARYLIYRTEILAKHQQYRNTERGRLVARNHDIKRRRLTKRAFSDITGDFLLGLRTSTPNCLECKCVLLTGPTYHPQQATLDHIIPLSKGGTHTKTNVRYICRKCNAHKSAKLPTNELR